MQLAKVCLLQLKKVTQPFTDGIRAVYTASFRTAELKEMYGPAE